MLGKVSTRICCTTRKDGNHQLHHYLLRFHLKDLVSYERKHNEKNGEDGEDGSDYNYSWNCGDEGNTRKKGSDTEAPPDEERDDASDHVSGRTDAQSRR